MSIEKGGVVFQSDEIASLRAEVGRLTSDLTLLLNRNEPEPHALHYDECPYKPFADLPRWEEPENPPTCTCSDTHKAAYWKARWMLTGGWRRVAERERDEALAQVAVLAQEAQKVVDNHEEGFSCQDGVAQGLPELLKNLPAEARALLDRLQRVEAVVEAGLRHKREVERNSQTGANHPIPPLCTHEHSPPNEYDASEEDLFKALAAWEEGKT